LLQIKRTITNRPHKSVADLLPMKHLAGIQRLLQIEIRRANFNHVREDNDEGITKHESRTAWKLQ